MRTRNQVCGSVRDRKAWPSRVGRGEQTLSLPARSTRLLVRREGYADYSDEITLSYTPLGTDNDFTDMVVEIQAFSPVKEEVSSFGKIKNLYRK